jgi:hypothetical protein
LFEKSTKFRINLLHTHSMMCSWQMLKYYTSSRRSVSHSLIIFLISIVQWLSYVFFHHVKIESLALFILHMMMMRWYYYYFFPHIESLKRILKLIIIVTLIAHYLLNGGTTSLAMMFKKQIGLHVMSFHRHHQHHSHVMRIHSLKQNSIETWKK